MTVVIVVLIIFNPETIELALFIDAVGLELFLILLEVQVLAIIGTFLSNRIKPAISGMKNILESALLEVSIKKAKERVEHLFISVSIEATLMRLLVIFPVIGEVFGM